VVRHLAGPPQPTTRDTSAWNICSYVASLSTRAALTTGLIDNQGYTLQKTFCVGRKKEG